MAKFDKPVRAATLEIRELIQRGIRFKGELKVLKQKLEPPVYGWYPYDSMANLVHFDVLLKGRNRRLLDLAGNEPILEIGSADGELAFFLESLGCRVHAMDCLATNHNQMTGIRRLKEALDSRIEIYEADLDGPFVLPEECYNLALMLGVLYHLKNPFHALETLSRQVRYCILSTRVARLLPPPGSDVLASPVAYLVDDYELNRDETNYWIFSPAGLRRLLKRTNWGILDYVAVGDTEKSDPVNPEHDERAFILAMSHFGLSNVRLLEGWHAPQPAGWRWTEQEFSLSEPATSLKNSSRVCMKLFLPEVLFQRWETITLFCRANGTGLEPEVFRAPGQHTWERTLPALSGEELRLSFQVDHALQPGEFGEHELGIIVASVDFE